MNILKLHGLSLEELSYEAEKSGLSQTLKVSEEEIEAWDKKVEQLDWLNASEGEQLPVVQMHGMGDFANNPLGMIPIKKKLAQHLNTYVVNATLSDSNVMDMLGSFVYPMQKEVDRFRDFVRKDPKLAKGFNAISYSQGSLTVRGYIEMYNDPPVVNWISFHGPLAGVAGIQRCNQSSWICSFIDHGLGAIAYNEVTQNVLAQSNFFRDPLRVPDQLKGCHFLPQINNEKEPNQDYYNRFTSLKSIVLVKAMKDTMIQPNESEWFGFFKDGDNKTLLTMKDTSWQLKDNFGLQHMDTNGKLNFGKTDGDHMQIPLEQTMQLVDHQFRK